MTTQTDTSDPAVAFQVLRLRHGHYTIPVLGSDGSRTTLALCACGNSWPCPVGVLLETYQDDRDVREAAINEQRALLIECRDLLRKILEEGVVNYDQCLRYQREFLYDQVVGLIDRLSFALVPEEETDAKQD